MGRKTQTIQSELVGTKPCSAANTPAHETVDDEETIHRKIPAIQWRYICAVLSGDQPQRNAAQAEQEKSIWKYITHHLFEREDLFGASWREIVVWSAEKEGFREMGFLADQSRRWIMPTNFIGKGLLSDPKPKHHLIVGQQDMKVITLIKFYGLW